VTEGDPISSPEEMTWRVYLCNSHRSFLSIVGQGSECEQVKWNPKGDELLQSTVKPWETAVEAGLYTDVQFVCRSLE